MSSVDQWRSKVVSALLFFSVATNLFFAGWFVGRQYFGPPPPSPRPFDLYFGERIQSALSPEGVKRMEAAFATIRDNFSSHERDAQLARNRLDETLRADHFDIQAYLAASTAVHQTREKDRTQADEELARVIAQLSADDRKKLADIRRRPPHEPRFGFGHR